VEEFEVAIGVEFHLSANLAILLATAGSIAFIVFPIMLGVISRHRGLTWQESGWIAMALQMGMLAGTLAALLFGRLQVSRRAVLIGSAALGAAASVLIACSANVVVLVCLEFATGAAAGCMFSIAGSLLALFPQPERNFAFTLGLQALCGSGYSALLLYLEGRIGNASAEVSIAGWFIAVFLLAYLLQGESVNSEIRKVLREESRPIDLRSGCAVLGLMSFQMAVLAIWLYSDRIGQRWGFSAASVDASIALGNLAAVPAGLLAAALRDRLGHPLITIASTGIVVAAEMFILWPQNYSSFALSQGVLNFGWALGLAYYIGLVVKVDDSGRSMRLVPVAVVIASAITPVFVAAFGRGGDLNSLAAICAAFGATAVGLTVLGARPRRQPLVAR
jgi:predicted MFS family arabinose efflux permease